MNGPNISAPHVGAAYDGANPLTVSTATVTASASGNTQVVAAVTGKSIIVLGAFVMANGTVNVKWQTATTDIAGLAYLIANTGYVLPYSQIGWFVTNAGEALNINLSGNVAVGGVVRYVTR